MVTRVRTSLLLAGLAGVAAMLLTATPASPRATLRPVELRAVQAAPAQGGLATLAVLVPSRGASCELEAESSLVAVAGPARFPCPSAEATRGVFLPANQGRHRQAWWVTLTVTDRAGRRSQRGLALEAKSAAWPGRRPLARVGVVGDSITNQANDAMVAAMAGSYSLRIDGRNGYLMGQQVPTLRSTVRGPYGRADAVAVELGTNNAVYGAYAAYWRNDPTLPQPVAANGNWPAQLDEVVRVLAGTRCGLLVNVTTSTSDPAFNAQARAINTGIAAAVASHPHLHLVDWAAALASHPDWYGHVNLMAEIHPNDAGRAGLASMIADALPASCGLVPGATR